MRILSILLLGLFSSLVAYAAPKPEITQYLCNDYKTPSLLSSQQSTLGRSDFNIPGRGMFSELTVTKQSQGTYIISGTVISNNTGGKISEVPIYLGNLDKFPRLRLMALSDADGRFKIFISPPLDISIEEAYSRLYTGRPYEILYAYPVAYKNAQQDAAANP